MERITRRMIDGTVYVPKEIKERFGRDAAVNLLAAYEDTGLTPDQIQEVDKLYKEKCELVAFKDSIMEAYIKVIDTAVALTYELLNEYDIGLWENTNLDLADKWTELIESGVLDEDELKGKLKAYFIEKARGQQ